VFVCWVELGVVVPIPNSQRPEIIIKFEEDMDCMEMNSDFLFGSFFPGSLYLLDLGS
jgi:hypothetical protein